MAWEYGSRYRTRVVPGEIRVKRTPNTNTPLVEVMCEVSFGDMKGQRAPYTHYLNSEENVVSTLRELRNMGWLGTKLGDWKGLDGRREFTSKLMGDEGKDKDGKPTVYPRFGFPSPLRVVSEKHSVAEADLEALNAQFGISTMTEALEEEDIPF